MSMHSKGNVGGESATAIEKTRMTAYASLREVDASQ